MVWSGPFSERTTRVGKIRGLNIYSKWTIWGLSQTSFDIFLARLRSMRRNAATARSPTLNTEKAHNLKERALEAFRIYRGLVEEEPREPESSFAFYLEDPSLVTLGIVYEERRMFAGGAYHIVLGSASSTWGEGPYL